MSALALGSWDGIVRQVAGHDYGRAKSVARWPVVEVLHAYLHMMREHAATDYRSRCMLWAATLQYLKGKDRKRPQRPAILDE